MDAETPTDANDYAPVVMTHGGTEFVDAPNDGRWQITRDDVDEAARTSLDSSPQLPEIECEGMVILYQLADEMGRHRRSVQKAAAKFGCLLEYRYVMDRQRTRQKTLVTNARGAAVLRKWYAVNPPVSNDPSRVDNFEAAASAGWITEVRCNITRGDK